MPSDKKNKIGYLSGQTSISGYSSYVVIIKALWNIKIQNIQVRDPRPPTFLKNFPGRSRGFKLAPAGAGNRPVPSIRMPQNIELADEIPNVEPTGTRLQMTVKFLIIIFLFNWASIESFMDIQQCGRSKSCWFIPPQCQNEPKQYCQTVISWEINASKLIIEFDSKIDDLSSTRFTGKYAALAFSEDHKMGDDSVVECIFKPDGTFEAYMSFNDDKNNHRLVEASDLMINATMGMAENSRIFCRTERRMFHNEDKQIPEKDWFKIFDLRDKNYHLLFAKGETMPGKGYELGIHSS
uniref:DOMON domain-containing protein n=1 Tax=Romanomermis culicivorax TaxID=13658 RepID=A0A915HW29_ROMCU